jgi:SPP1 family predicted phage head-tail adaptor
MSIGAMRSRVEIQKYTSTSDGGGGGSVAWSKVASVFAQITPKTARKNEFGEDNQQREVVTHLIKIRYRSDFTTKNRIHQTYSRDGIKATRTFNIKGIINVDNKFKYMELTCEEGVPT